MPATLEAPIFKPLPQRKILILAPEDPEKGAPAIKQPRRLSYLYISACLLGIIAALVFSDFINLDHIDSKSPWLFDSVNGQPEHFDPQTRQWVPILPGYLLPKASFQIRTNQKSGVDLYIPDKLHIRLKPGSEILSSYTGSIPQIILIQGSALIAASAKITVPAQWKVGSWVIKPGTSRFLITHFDGVDQISVLEGFLYVDLSQDKTIPLRAFQKIRTHEPAPSEITDEDWRYLKEAYGLTVTPYPASPNIESLASSMGNFFPMLSEIKPDGLSSSGGYLSATIRQNDVTDQHDLSIRYDVTARESAASVVFLLTNPLSKPGKLTLELLSEDPSANQIFFQTFLREKETGSILAPLPSSKSGIIEFKINPDGFDQLRLTIANKNCPNMKRGTFHIGNISWKEIAGQPHTASEQTIQENEKKDEKNSMKDVDLDELLLKLQTINKVLRDKAQPEPSQIQPNQ